MPAGIIPKQIALLRNSKWYNFTKEKINRSKGGI
jgi:hypothetical protein